VTGPTGGAGVTGPTGPYIPTNYAFRVDVFGFDIPAPTTTPYPNGANVNIVYNVGTGTIASDTPTTGTFPISYTIPATGFWTFTYQGYQVGMPAASTSNTCTIFFESSATGTFGVGQVFNAPLDGSSNWRFNLSEGPVMLSSGATVAFRLSRTGLGSQTIFQTIYSSFSGALVRPP
jgi:hypothetical protein